MKYKVLYNTHRYSDCSDRARQATRIIIAETPDDAREILRLLNKSGTRWIGMIFDAEPVSASPGGA